MKRGANAPLTRENPGLTGVVFGVRFNPGAEKALIDNLAVATILCDQGGKAVSAEHFVFFNQLTSPELSVVQLAEALDGDHEQIEIDLKSVPADVSRIVVVTYINEGANRRRSLSQLRGCVIRVLDLKNNIELVRSENLTADLADETGLALGEIYRHGSDWKFKVIGEGYARGITDIAADYRIPL